MKFKKLTFLLITLLICSYSLTAQESVTTQPDEQGVTVSQPATPGANEVQTIDPNTMTNLTDFGSMWEITKLAGGLRWVIFLVLAVGLLTILYKSVELFIDNRRAIPINRLNLATASVTEIEDVVANSSNSWAKQLSNNMLKIFRTTERAEDFHYEITNFIQSQQDKFSAFQGKMAFLSDTAGALGLLGTVWGMFVTFSRGILDNQIILTGMGIALVTTLMGLVVSIILNFFYTQIHGYFSKKIDAIQSIGEELRLQLLKKQKSRRFTAYGVDRRGKTSANVKIQPSDTPTELKQDSTKLESDITTPVDKEQNSRYQLISVSGDKQSAQVNSRLKQPFWVQVRNGNEKGAGGQCVVFSIEKGTGTLENGSKVEELITDTSGFAKCNLLLSNVAGENLVKASLKRGNGEYITFNAVGNPASPSELKYVSGNLQNSPAGQKLKEPLVVKLIDDYDNPIPDHTVIFKVKIGKGYFPGNKRNYIARTDNNGIAQSHFTLRPEPGFNSISVSAKGLRKSKIEFEALGQ